MKLPFETQKIFITLDDDTFYQLHSDYSKTEVNKNVTEEALLESSVQPFMVIHKNQFEYGKSHLMNKENPKRISKETAEIYHRIGFISKDELDNYIKL